MWVQLNRNQVHFILRFSLTFSLLYGFNLAFIGLSTRPGYYLAFLHDHLNYIDLWRSINIKGASTILKISGYHVVESATSLSVFPNGGFNLVYSCLGYGVMSSFAAFILSYPGLSYPGRHRFKALYLVGGLIITQVLNILRLVCLALFWNHRGSTYIDHHLLFNITVYGTLIYYTYLCSHKKYNSK